MGKLSPPLQLMLASQSRYRHELLRRLGVDFESCPHRCDEEAAAAAHTGDAAALAQMLARAKVDSVAAAYPDAFILGSDQVVATEIGEILGKPGTAEAAMAQLAQLQGREHQLITAVVLKPPLQAAEQEIRQALDIHRMRMRPLRADEIERYVRADMPVDCCGSYKIESRGIALFEAIEGCDFTAITGLPLMAVATMLRAAGFANIP